MAITDPKNAVSINLPLKQSAPVNWFEMLAIEANQEAFKNIKIKLLQNIEETALEKAKDITDLAVPSAGEAPPSGESHTDLESIHFGRRGEVNSQEQSLTLISAFFKEIKDSIFSVAQTEPLPTTNTEKPPSLTVQNIFIDEHTGQVTLSIKIDGPLKTSIELQYTIQISHLSDQSSQVKPSLITENITVPPSSEPTQIIHVPLPIPTQIVVDGTESIDVKIYVPNDIIIQDALPTPPHTDEIQTTLTSSSPEESPPKITVGNVHVDEGGVAIFSVTLDKPSTHIITLDFTTAPGTAITGGSGLIGENDFVANSGTITFLPGQTSVTINILTLSDAIYEDNESFTINFSHVNGGGATLETHEAHATIIDVDIPPIARGGEFTLHESLHGNAVESTGNVFDHDSAGNNQAVVSAIKFTFEDEQSAQNYLQTHPELADVVLHHTTLEIPIQNGTIGTPLGGTFTIQPSGEYTYIAPNVSSDTSDVVSYVLKNHSGDVSEAPLIFHIIDEIPTAVADFGVIERPEHNYNIVLSLDVSGSMNELINGQTRLHIAKEALVDLIDSYSHVADHVHITIVPFGSGSENTGAFAYTATSVEDAKDYILKEGTHSVDGVAIGMINPDTNHALGTGTQYNDALYQAREHLVNDLTDLTLQGYESRVYFLSDGQPTAGSDATNTGNWPQGWSSWQDFINQNAIQAYAISIAAGQDAASALQPVANQHGEVIDVNADLSNLSQLLLQTLPNIPLEGNVLANDILKDGPGGHVTEISFNTLNASQYILDNHLDSLGAVTDNNGFLVHIPISAGTTQICFITPLGNTLTIDSTGAYHYDANPVSQDQSEIFNYTVQEQGSEHTAQASLTITVTATGSVDAFSDIQDAAPPTSNVIAPHAVGAEFTVHEPTHGTRVISTGDVFDHDSAGNDSGVVSSIKFTFANDQTAQAYLSQHSDLVGTELNNMTLEIPISNGLVMTPLGGTFLIQSTGEYTYTAPAGGVNIDSNDIISYVIKDHTGDTSESALTFHVIDESPRANDDLGYIAKPELNYNLVLSLDVSGSMNDVINGQTRLQIAKNALVDLINNYSTVADNLHITIAPFGSGNGNTGSFAYIATSADDAKAYILKTGSHRSDGIAIGMINPDTNTHLGTGTQYNDALYQARTHLASDLADPTLQSYESRVYFLSDGQPTAGSSATDTAGWPSSWSSWQDFVNQNSIHTFAISIDAGTGAAMALQPVANHASEVLDVKSDLSNLSEVMIQTLPDSILEENVLKNDILNDVGGGSLTEISFQTLNATQYIEENNLQSLGAIADNDGKVVHIHIPGDNTAISFATPLGSTLTIDSSGNYSYDAKPVGHNELETFNYTIQEHGSNQTSQATLTINVLNDSHELHNLSGDIGNNTLSDESLQGVTVMFGGQGHDNFIIDTAQDTHGNVVIIKDLADNPLNSLTFIHADDNTHDGVLTLEDVVHSVSQSGENADVIVKLNNGVAPDHSDGTTVIFENVGTLPGNDVASLTAHLEQVTAQLNVLH